MLARDDPDPPRAHLEDLVPEHEVLEGVARVEHDLHRRPALGDPAPGEIVLEPADAVEVRVEATAGGRLDEIEDVLTVAEPVERRREGTDLEAHLPEEQQEGGDTRQLGEGRADPLGARRRLDPHELLGPVHERNFVREARQPVDAVDERRHLGIRAELGELLVPAVHVPDHRIGREDALAVEAHDETQRAVGGRVLRPEVEDHVAGVELDVDLRVGEVAHRFGWHGHVARHLDGSLAPVDPRVGRSLRRLPITPRLGAARRLAGHSLDVDEAGPWLHDPSEQREVLTQRVPLELEREEEVTQRGVSVELDAVHLPALPLVPVGTGVDRHPRRDLRGCFVDVGLEREPPQARRRLDVREHLEPSGRTGGAEGHLGRLHRRRRIAGVTVAFSRAPVASRYRQ